MKTEKVDYTGTYIVKIDKLQKEIERLNNIIKEAIEYIRYNDYCDAYELLEILKGEHEQ